MVTIDILRNEADTLAIAAGQAVFKEGDIGGQTMFVVVEGEVDLLKWSSSTNGASGSWRSKPRILPCR